MDNKVLFRAEREIQQLIRLELSRLTPEQKKELLIKIRYTNVHLTLSVKELKEIYEDFYTQDKRYALSFLFDFTIKLNFLLKRLSANLIEHLTDTLALSYSDLWNNSSDPNYEPIASFLHQQQTTYSSEEVKKLLTEEKWIFGLMIFILYNEEIPE